ncbi:hypothetical protein HYE82_29725 [Streptomyces sp. BR123]|uniref:hypothetical protein n=1 Tax=Streptomyces sp. BR123 TaxID=2749828 RepID=UPI0015C45162|nr:hypothetical protein [Streptomyces sp. BR123]NXY98482.1 hypothetical protein [Streptomyces sp. BR123]
MVDPGGLTREDLYVPDRFEMLRDVGTGALQSIITPVQDALIEIDVYFADMRAARRGALMVLRGETGAGKSTFLDTLGLFRTGLVTERIPASENVAEALQSKPRTEAPRVIVLEGREALGEASVEFIEAAMHGINSFVRSDSGRDTLVVWPANTDDLTALLTEKALKIGGEALLGVGEPVTRFSGPAKNQFVSIAERTVGALNEGASLAALGISEEAAERLASQASTIGRFLALVRQALIRNGAKVRSLMAAEQFRLWTLVIAGNEPEGDVAALTRGGYAYADIDRLMTATNANIVADLKKQPDQLGILGTVFDAKIIHVDMMTALAVSRQYGDTSLHSEMTELGMSTSSEPKAIERLLSGELGLLMGGNSLGLRKRGGKAGSNTLAAFESLAFIATKKDGLLNKAIGTGLQEVGLINSFQTERELGTEYKYFSDLYCERPEGPIRLEMMWRKSTSRAEIANYVLSKLGNYGRAIGLLT